MENINEKIRRSLQELKAFEIKKLRKLEREQKAFMEEIREKFEMEIIEKKSKDDLLSPKQITSELGISRKTFDRWIEDGLEILQRTPGSSIRVKREDVENFLSHRYNVR